MSLLRVRVGPLPAASARAWLDNTQHIVDVLRHQPDWLAFQLPDEIADIFDRYLAAWREAAESGDVFDWSGEADVAEVRDLVLYWFNIDALSDADLERLGVSWSGPEAEPFFLALTDAIVGALAAEEETAEFGHTLSKLWPREPRFSRAEAD